MCTSNSVCTFLSPSLNCCTPVVTVFYSYQFALTYYQMYHVLNIFQVKYMFYLDCCGAILYILFVGLPQVYPAEFAKDISEGYTC